MGNSRECAQRILLMLKTINQLDISPKTRRNIIDNLHRPITEISLVLERRYANQRLPLTAKSRQIAALTIALHTEIAISYKILIEHYWTKKLSFLTTKSMAMYIHHTIFYLGKILLTGYEIYSTHPPNTWIHIHQLYLYAEDNNLHTQQTHGANNDMIIPTCSIENLYKQTLLLGLVSPFRLQQAETRKVYLALGKWSSLCKVLPAENFSGNSDQILLKLNSDHAPGYHFLDTSISHNMVRTIDNSALIRQISALLVEKQSFNDQVTDEIAYDVMKLLLITWSGKSKRLFARTPQKNRLSAIIGLSAIHFTMTNLQRPNATLANTMTRTSPFESIVQSHAKNKLSEVGNINRSHEPSVDTRAEFNRPVLLNTETIDTIRPDVWSNDFGPIGQTEHDHPKVTKNINDTVTVTSYTNYLPLNVDNINESAGGYCLFGYAEPKTTLPKLQIGEVIGIRGNPDNTDNLTISIGVVTRLKNQQNGIQFGVLKLAPYADAVATCPYHKRLIQRQHDRSLLLPSIKSVNQTATLLLNPLYKENDELLIDKQGYKLRVKLSKLLTTTGNFNRFEFEVTKVIGLESNPKQQTQQHDTLNQDSEWSLI